MTIRRTYWKTWLKYVAVGAAAVVLFIPFVLLSMLADLGQLLLEGDR